MKPYIRSPTKLQRALMKAQDWKCFHCDEPMFFQAPKGTSQQFGATREHVFPHASTGKGLVHNIVLAHMRCNHKRGDRQPTHYEISKAAGIYKAINLTPFIMADSPEGQAALKPTQRQAAA